MKKIFLICCCLGLFSLSASAQKNETLKLKKGCQVLDITGVNNGLVILTGREFLYSFNREWKLTYYNPNLTLRYEVPIKHAKLGGSSLVMSPTGNSVYFIRYSPAFWSSKVNASIIQIDSSGTYHQGKLRHKFKFENVNAVFSDDEYLYYVLKENTAKGRRGKKNAYPQIKFGKISNKDFSYTQVDVAVPEPEEDATEWSFIGNTTEVSYFASLKIENDQKAVYRVAVIDDEGKLLDDFKMSVNIKDGNFVPGNQVSNVAGSEILHSHKFTRHVSYYSTGRTTTTVITYTANPEAFVNISFDPQTNGFYITGLSGKLPSNEKKGLFHKKEYSKVNNYYLFKFDQDGKESWKLEGKLVSASDNFKNKSSFLSRESYLDIGIKGNLRYQVFMDKDVATYEINPETGKYLTGYSNTFKNYVTTLDLGTCRKPGDKSALGKFLNKNDRGDYSTMNFRMQDNNVIMRNYYNDDKVELYNIGDE